MALPIALLLALVALVALPSAAAQAAEAPAWKLQLSSEPTVFAPGGEGRYLLIATNVGAKAAAGTIALIDTLPEGLTPLSAGARAFDPAASKFPCAIAAQTVSCEGSGPVHPGLPIELEISAGVASLPDPTILSDEAELSGGGAAAAHLSAQTTISATPAPFGFLGGEAGFADPVVKADGNPATDAGSHPQGLASYLSFPTEVRGGNFVSSGHLRDATVDFPPGTLADPAASPVLCTEAELITENGPGCPPKSAVGTATATTQIVNGAGFEPNVSPLYAMVPPPGAPAAFGFDAIGAGIFVHVLGELRSDSDFGLSGSSHDVLARNGNPIFAVSVELWGDPSSPSHDASRGNCLFATEPHTCPFEPPQPIAFLTMPGHCPGTPATYRAHADSWEEPGIERKAAYQSADLAGNPVSLSGCNALQFKPTISSQPTTNLADSPSGLQFDLRQPQDMRLGEEDEGRASAELRDARVTLPAGMAVNPSQADGLGACSEQQVGYLSEDEEAGVHFSKAPQSCPDASKLGSVEVTSPLLPQRDAEHELQEDPETGEPIPQALHGSVYLAKPFANPFGSLLAIYLAVEDPQSGIVAKLAGRVEPDPNTGQLTTVFEENPQLPLEDIKLHLFEGARAPLITPPTCATHTTTSDLTPWSSPEGADAHPTDSFQTTAEPGGGGLPDRRIPPGQRPLLQRRHPQPGGRRLLALRAEALPRRRLPAPDRPRHHPAPGAQRQAGRDRRVLRCPDRGSPIEEPSQRRHPRARKPLLPGLQRSRHGGRRRRRRPHPLPHLRPRLPRRPL